MRTLSLRRSNRVRVPRDLDAVTTIDHAAEEDPAAAGMTRADVDAIWSAAEGMYATGTQPALALCVRRRGRVVLSRAIGHARGGGPGDAPDEAPVRATPATPFCLFSVSKAVTAMVMHLLDRRDLLRLDDPVAEFIPEFGTHGKERITLRHVMTHRAGIPSVAGHNDPGLLVDPERVLQLLCDARPTSVPGRRLAYHAITGGFVLGEIVRRVTGKAIRDVVRDELQRPLGFKWFNYGVAPAEMPLVARNYFTGAPPPAPAALLVRRALGVAFEQAVEVSNDPRYLTSVVPSGNLVATAGELAAFFQLLLDDGQLGGVRLFDRRTIRRALTESAFLELDLTLGVPVRYGQGFMLGTPWLSLFGPDTPRAFGHYGFTNTIGWADPQRDLAVGLLTSGKPFLGLHVRQHWDLLRQLARRCAG